MCRVGGAGHQVGEEPDVLARFQVGDPSKSGLDSQLLLINLLNLSFLICRKRTRPCRVAELMRDDAYSMCHARRALSTDSNYCCDCFQKASWVCRAQHNGQGRPSDSRKHPARPASARHLAILESLCTPKGRPTLSSTLAPNYSSIICETVFERCKWDPLGMTPKCVPNKWSWVATSHSGAKWTQGALIALKLIKTLLASNKRCLLGCYDYSYTLSLHNVSWQKFLPFTSFKSQ